MNATTPNLKAAPPIVQPFNIPSDDDVIVQLNASPGLDVVGTDKVVQQRLRLEDEESSLVRRYGAAQFGQISRHGRLTGELGGRLILRLRLRWLLPLLLLLLLLLILPPLRLSAPFWIQIHHPTALLLLLPRMSSIERPRPPASCRRRRAEYILDEVGVALPSAVAMIGHGRSSVRRSMFLVVVMVGLLWLIL